LREDAGWDATPYQWATVGYSGAIDTGKTICGILFGASKEIKSNQISQ
jgi:hypothetical protein